METIFWNTASSRTKQNYRNQIESELYASLTTTEVILKEAGNGQRLRPAQGVKSFKHAKGQYCKTFNQIS